MRLNLLTALLLTFGTAGYAEIISYSNFGGWDIDLYTGDDDKPYGCLGYVQYEPSDTMIWIGFEKDGDKELVSFSMANSAWSSIETGKEYELIVEFPKDDWTLSSTGTSLDDFNMVAVKNVLNEKSLEFIADFRKSVSMKVSIHGNLIGNYTLKGTSGMLAQAWECYSEKVKPIGNDPFNVKPRNQNERTVSDPFDL